MAASASVRPAYALVIHGGAGDVTRTRITTDKQDAYRIVLLAALQAGESILQRGGTSLDAVVACIEVMEDSPLFNAGKGGVFSHEGRVECDASIMLGGSKAAGAVAGLRTVKNPIKAARAVMEHSPHVMLIGEGADAFSAVQGLTIVEPSYFHTEYRLQQLQQLKASGTYALDHSSTSSSSSSSASSSEQQPFDPVDGKKHGTVGAVAMDLHGNIVAGTSTGGMTNKRWGRVGDTPILGAGTYASNQTCGVSCTGTGEYFMRLCVAHDISACMEYGKQSLLEAARHIVHDKLSALGGDGGIIGIDATSGDVVIDFNSAGMFRGYAKAGGAPCVEMFDKTNPM